MMSDLHSAYEKRCAPVDHSDIGSDVPTRDAAGAVHGESLELVRDVLG